MATLSPCRFPSQDDVEQALTEVRLDVIRDRVQDVDVRLQVYGPEHSDEWNVVAGRTVLRWALRVGCSDYDQDHRGYWGSSCVSRDDDRASIARTAEDLLSQCRDHAAQNGLEFSDDAEND